MSETVLEAARVGVPCSKEEYYCHHFDGDACADGCLWAALINAAILAERERCAKIAETMPWHSLVAGQSVADAIRQTE